MGYRDVEVLVAVSGNQAKFEQTLARLQEYADSVALGLFSHTVLREDAVEKAMDKLKDWLGTDGPLRVDHPWAYAKRTVSNSLIDSARTRKLEGVSLDARMIEKHGNVKRNTIKHQMALIDDQFAELDNEEGRSEDNDEGTGWQLFEIIDQPPEPTRRDNSSRLPLSYTILVKMLQYQWWWDVFNWHKKVMGERKKQARSFDGSWEEAKSKCKEYGRKLWNKYNLLSALIDNISSASEKRILLYFLWGFKQVQIAKELNISAARVSSVLSRLKDWGWEEPDVYQARLILLTHHLAHQYKGLIEMKIRSCGEPLKLRELEDMAKGFFSKLTGIEEAIEEYKQQSSSPPRELEGEREYTKSHIDEIMGQINNMNELYNKITSDPQTRIYFNELQKSESDVLPYICKQLHSRWHRGKFYTQDARDVSGGLVGERSWWEGRFLARLARKAATNFITRTG